jgi:hypothetical protein
LLGLGKCPKRRPSALGGHAVSREGNIMTLLIHVVLVLIVVGVLLWLINTYLPMASSIKSILNFVVVVAVILWLLQVFGIWNVGSLHL